MSRPLTLALAGALVVGGVAAIAVTIDDDHLAPTAAAVSGEASASPARGSETTDTAAAARPARRAEARAQRARRRASTTTTAPASERDGPPPADAASCPSTAHGAVIDRANQRAWLCQNGGVYDVLPITTAASQPDPGTYPVYAKDLQTTSAFGDRPSTLDRFVAFTHGKYTGARIAFHAIPRYFDGTLAQTPESVGDPALYGASSGCIRVLPEDAETIWNFLAIGDEVRVIS